MRPPVTRYCGELVIELRYRGRTSDDRAEYFGAVIASDGRRWRFSNLASGVGAVGTRPEDFDVMAASAVCFASYYASDNRGEGAPAWAPPADLADVFSDAADIGEQGYLIRRTADGPVLIEG